MKRFLLLILIFTAPAFADGWWVYTYEDTSTLKAVFNYLAMARTDSGYMKTIQVIIIVGLVFTIIMKFLDLMAIPKYLITVIALMLLTFSATTKVHIVNVKSYNAVNPTISNYSVVDNVPFLFAVVSSAFTNIGYHSALLIETIFTNIVNDDIVTETTFLKTGQNGIFKIIEILDSIDPIALNAQGKEFATKYSHYVKDCVFTIGFSMDPSLKQDLLNAPDLFEAVNPANSAVLTKVGNQKVYDSGGTIRTCSNLYSEAKFYYDKVKMDPKAFNAAMNKVSFVTANKEQTSSAIVDMMTASDLTNSQANITNYIMNNGMRKAYQNALSEYSVGSAQAGFGAGLAEANYQIQGKTKAKAASSLIPSMYSVLQAVMYVLFPFVFLVVLFSANIKLLTNYILGLVWIELWVPSFSVLSFFTVREMQEEALGHLMNSGVSQSSAGMLTLSNQNEIYTTIANHAAAAADMYWMIPGIAGFILFASFYGLAGITQAGAQMAGMYSNNQTLEAERAKMASYDALNTEMQKNDPLYTGNVGTISAMVAQQGHLSQASKAAAEFLATGSSLNKFDNMTKSHFSKGAEDSAMSHARAQMLNSGSSSVQGSMGVGSELSKQKASGDIGQAGATVKNPDLLGNIEEASRGDTTFNATSGSNKYNSMGDDVSSVASSVGRGEGRALSGESEALNNLTNEELEKAATQSKYSSTVEESSKFDNLNKNGSYFDNTSYLLDEKARMDINKLEGETKGSRQQSDYEQQASSETQQITTVAQNVAKKEALESNFGSLKSGAEEVAKVKEGTEAKAIKDSIDFAGGTEELISTKAKQEVGNISKAKGEQDQLGDSYISTKYTSGQIQGAKLSGEVQGMNEVGISALIQASKVEVITSAANAQAEINALEAMKKVNLLDKDVSLYDKKISDGGNFKAVSKDGDSITMFTDGKGNIIGYQKETINPDTEDGGAGVKTIHSPDGRILSKIEEGSNQKNYQNTKDLRFGTNYGIENEKANYAGLNEKLREDMARAENIKDKEKIIAKFLEDTRQIDAVANPVEMGKTVAKQAKTGYQMDALKQNYERLADSDEKAFDKALYETLKGPSEFLAKNIPGGGMINSVIEGFGETIGAKSKNSVSSNYIDNKDAPVAPTPSEITESPKETVNRLHSENVIAYKQAGSSLIKDWGAVENLSKKEVDNLIAFDDFYKKDTERLKEISESKSQKKEGENQKINILTENQK